MSDPAALRRHDLAWLGRRWREALLAPLAPQDEDALDDWFCRDRPAVVRRLETGTPAGAVALGVALPGPGRRIGLLVGAGAVARRAGPLPLGDAAASAPEGWRAPLAALATALAAAGAPATVFGSLAWQHLTGERYLRAASDVDLLLCPAGAAALRAGLGLLDARDGRPVRLDGEVLVGDGGAVAWRELARRPAQVLVKSLEGVALRPLGEALGPLAEGLA